MKKLVLAAALAGVSTLAVANTGYYVQGNVGYSKLEFKDSEFKLKDSGASYGVAVGKKVGDMRYALDYTNFGKIKVSENEERVENFIDTGVNNVTEHYKGEVTTHSLGLSAIYDFAPVSGFTPYAGARLGVNQVKSKDSTVIHYQSESGTRTFSDFDSAKETKVGVGALAGVQYAINPNLAVDAGVEYNYLGKFDGVKGNQYGAKVGLRYSF